MGVGDEVGTLVGAFVGTGVDVGVGVNEGVCVATGVAASVGSIVCVSGEAVSSSAVGLCTATGGVIGSSLTTGSTIPSKLQAVSIKNKHETNTKQSQKRIYL